MPHLLVSNSKCTFLHKGLTKIIFPLFVIVRTFESRSDHVIHSLMFTT